MNALLGTLQPHETDIIILVIDIKWFVQIHRLRDSITIQTNIL